MLYLQCNNITQPNNKMENENGYSCAECHKNFESSASSLLQHYALHASLDLIVNPKESINKKKMNIPDLFPIADLKQTHKEPNVESLDQDIDSRIEDLINPLSLCVVSITDTDKTPKVDVKKTKKFKCTYCSRCFGWSTDLKRHILTHTGQRPFECDICDATFTRKVALTKHKSKLHAKSYESKILQIPALRPIGALFKQKTRKQDKYNIKKRFYNTKLQICEMYIKRNIKSN